MGRLESLTALALGRGHYEEEVLENLEASPSGGLQLYNDRGYPRNPETKRLEREHVRAANEVMQVTGVVEDTIAAKAKASQYLIDKNQETFTGLRLMEAGRAILVGGVWGVLGLRRRILLYKPYSKTALLNIVRREASAYSISHLVFSGLPTVLAYHVSDWLAFLTETIIEAFFDEDENDLSEHQIRARRIIQGMLDAGFCYITLHFRMFAILQQLNLIPSSRLLPSLRSFVPFSRTSPLQLPPNPSLSLSSLVSWGVSLFVTVAPFLMILVHGKVKYMAARIMYRPIYKTLPRPSGDSMFAGLNISTPLIEYDTPDRNTNDRSQYRSEDEPTLRALEGLPALERTESRPQQNERDHDSSGEEDEEMTHATLISFDVEATDVVESSLGTWSAELRSANEPKPSSDVKYRVTGVTMLPPILATEGMREIAAGILVMPLEALMVRVIGRAYRDSAGLGVEDMYALGRGFPSVGNLCSVLAVQLAVTGVIWTGFTAATQWWVGRRRASLAENAVKEASLT